jgi:hypothetical protein
MESKVLVDTLSLWALCFVEIDNIPLLSCSSIAGPNLNRVAFFIFTSFNIKNLLALPVNELVVLILEYLEPS